ncbi:MAG: class I SAM-dependent methyltransferase [Pseudomonadota bacterium]
MSYEAFAKQERSGWTDRDIVAAYVAKFGPITDYVAQDLVGRLSVKNKKVLDLCCGQGALTAMLVDEGAQVSGLDFSEEMLELCRAYAPGADLRQGDAAALPFGDKCFDAVVCNFGMMHLPNQPQVLKEICRTLRSDATFLMATWAPPEDSPAFGTVFGAIRAHADFTQAPAQPDLFMFARPEDARQLMSTAGLKMIAHETMTPAWEITQPVELFDIFLNATVGAAMLIKSQKDSVIAAIRDQIASTVAEKFSSGTGYRIPVPVAVVTAMPS